MPVTAAITRDPAGNPWPPVHEHEATAAIGLVQRLYEALNHERSTYAVLANLQAPGADLLVLTEMGLGVLELKHYSGELSLQAGDWYAGQHELLLLQRVFGRPRSPGPSTGGRARRRRPPPPQPAAAGRLRRASRGL